MYIPFLSTKRAVRRRNVQLEDVYDDMEEDNFDNSLDSLLEDDELLHNLEKRKGGGGGGRGGGGGGGRGGSGSSGSSGGRTGSGGSRNTNSKTTISTAGNGKTSSPYSNGGAPRTTIPSGAPFAGRSQGGATRSQVYGTRNYGSGYPDRGYNSRGVGGLGFPFVFWPIAWGGVGYYGGSAYLHNREYGDPDNSTRPGGPMVYSTYHSLDSSKNSTFHVVADNATIAELMVDIQATCGSLVNNDTSSISGSRDPTAMANISMSQPQPESTVQYYRASSISLTLDGYNNTAAFGDDENAEPVSLGYDYDGSLLACLNSTIGEASLLVDGSAALFLLPGWLMLSIGVSVGAVMSL